jgi:hypothetical protein
MTRPGAVCPLLDATPDLQRRQHLRAESTQDLTVLTASRISWTMCLVGRCAATYVR